MKRSTFQRVAWLAPWVLAIGCGGNNNTVLSTVTPATSCASGKGVTISSGVDQNGNGVLDQREVAQTSNICDGVVPSTNQGTAGFNTVVATTDLANGDPNCTDGGTEIQTGLDDGSGGGTAGDGMLQPGEVKSTQYVCNAGLPLYPGSMTPPEGPAGTYKLDASGGDGSTGNGGNGSTVTVEISNGSLGGHAMVFKTGVADASFTMPSLTFDGGATVMTVTVDTPLNSYANPAAGITATDAYFQVNGDQNLYANVAGVATIVTGIDVQAGKTLTFAANFGGYANVLVNQDVRNAGIITMSFVGNNSRSLELHARNVIGVAGSSISTAGKDVTGTAGGSAGYADLYAAQSIVNEGTITAKGGDGDSGANGSEIQLSVSLGGVWNKGALTTNGGKGAVTTGGSGGQLLLYGAYQGVYNSGALNALGGQALTVTGQGGYVELNAENLGAVINSGAIKNPGGPCDGAAVNCSGNGGGGVGMYSYSGALTNSGDIDSSGADGKGTGNGGAGGDIVIENHDSGTNPSGQIDLPTGDLRFSGTLSSKGGTGAAGGSAASITIQLDCSDAPHGAQLVLLGYTDVKTRGGNSTGGNGGLASNYDLTNAYSYPQGGYYAPGGAVINYANVDASGGDGVLGRNGGSVSFDTQTSYHFADSFEIAENHGIITAHGGASSGNNNGGRGGSFDLEGLVGAKNTGAINVSGGTSAGATNTGGLGWQIYMSANYGPCENTAQLDAYGGAAMAAGANGGGTSGSYSVEIEGFPAINSGAINAFGGAGGTNGGNGGYVELFSSSSATSSNSGAVAVTGGTGGTAAGGKGKLFVDGSNMTP